MLNIGFLAIISLQHIVHLASNYCMYPIAETESIANENQKILTVKNSRMADGCHFEYR